MAIPLETITERSMDGINRIRAGDTSLCDWVYKFGFNGDVDTTEETVWDQGGLYQYIQTAAPLQFSSSSADDAAAGTGARMIRAEGLDANFDDLKETITLDGQTPVSSIGEFYRIFRMYVLTAGSTETAQGDIYAGLGTVTAGVPATVHAKITEGENQTLMAVYTVPKNRLGLILSASISTGKAQSNVINARSVFRLPGGVFRTGGRFVLNNSRVVEDVAFPIPLTEGTDYEIRAAGSANNIDVSATFQVMVLAA